MKKTVIYKTEDEIALEMESLSEKEWTRIEKRNKRENEKMKENRNIRKKQAKFFCDTKAVLEQISDKTEFALSIGYSSMYIGEGDFVIRMKNEEEIVAMLSIDLKHIYKSIDKDDTNDTYHSFGLMNVIERNVGRRLDEFNAIWPGKRIEVTDTQKELIITMATAMLSREEKIVLQDNEQERCKHAFDLLDSRPEFEVEEYDY